ncbi:Wzz/FepE/Etk N-terminal domain-containing protein [Pseudoalteromonas sp. 20-MNA-CIBAN-0454]|uniref:Wzz/FepE/Etk N-terminal domain-containing protein n=1 Tax=Pseudoalteromonas sp. 20-MNA-CIBAN-0454 TaxID=3140424 RepID=UPI00333434F5
MDNNLTGTKTSNTYAQNHGVVDKDIDLRELFSIIWQGKWIVIIITALFAIASVVYAIKQPNIYRATTLLAPVSDQSGAGGLAKMAGQFGGLASLAGISLGAGGTDKTGLALEVLQSRRFIESFIDEHQLLVPLIAAKNWNAVNNELLLDDELYNAETKTWIREVKAPKTAEPSTWEAYKAFKKVLSVNTDKETGMITLAIEHHSPEIAKQWLLWLVSDINETMRDQDKLEAKNSIEYLAKKLQETQLADMKTVFYQLIEEQTKTIMLAEVAQEYVVKTIDPANAPDEKAHPKRALIVILITLLGLVLSIMCILLHYFTKK